MAWYERDYYSERGGGFGSPLGGSRGLSITVWLIIINAVIFLLDGLLSAGARTQGLFGVPPQALQQGWGPLSWWGSFSVNEGLKGFQMWRLVTYQFMHGGFFHILVNMLILYFFGPLIENWWGSRRFLAFYLLCGVTGAVVMSVLSIAPELTLISPAHRLVGASGSIFGILVAAAVLIGIMFVAIGVGFSALVNSETQATMGGVVLFFMMYLWPFILQFGVSRLFNRDIPAFVGRFSFLSLFADIIASRSPSGDGLTGPSSAADLTGNSDPSLFMQNWFVFVILALWIVVPLALGYYRFETTDL